MTFKWYKIACLLPLLTLALTACGGEDAAAPPNNPPPTPDPVPAIAFFDDTQGNPRYAIETNSWSVEIIDANVSGGFHISLAFDSKGVPHVAYKDGTADDLKYATKPAGTWNTEIVESDGDAGRWASIAIDAQDRPHIAYTKGPDDEVKYAVKIGANWTTEVAASATAIGVGSAALFVDNQGRPHISFLDATATGPVNVRYSVKDGATWTTETIKSYNIADFGSRNSIVIDAQGKPHTTYSVNGALFRAVKSGGVWTDEEVDSPQGFTGQYSSLRLNSQDQLVCAYTDFDGGAPNLASHDGLQWTIEVADTAAADFVTETSLALDRNDKPYISYYESTVKRLKVARKNGNNWIVETVDPNLPMNSQTSIAIKQ